MKYYVYHAYGLNGELLYVGKGTGGRLRHCNSGISSNFELNKYYFENGSDSIRVEIVKRFETNEEALSYERFCILTLKTLFNNYSVIYCNINSILTLSLQNLLVVLVLNPSIVTTSIYFLFKYSNLYTTFL